MQLTSDLFFSTALEDHEVCEEFINIITGLEVNILEVKNQYTILNLTHHSITMDIFGKSTDGKLINIEMHPQSGENRIKRIRYNTSSIDVKTLQKITESEYFPKLVQRVQYLKNHQKGVEIMCEIVDEAIKPLLEEIRIESEKRGEKRGKKRGKKLGRYEAIIGMVQALNELGVSTEIIILQLMKQFNLSENEAKKLI